jgi:hypothetical protein
MVCFLKNLCGHETLAVIARLVRSCAPGRAIQYAVTILIRNERRGVLDAPPARGMTG